MFQRDFILKQIEQMAHVLGVIMGLKKGGLYAEALQKIDETLSMYAGLPEILALGIPEFMEKFDAPGEAKDFGFWAEVGKLLAARADLEAQAGNAAESRRQRLVALHILLRVTHDEPHILRMEAEAVAQELLAGIGPADLPPQTKRLLF